MRSFAGQSITNEHPTIGRPIIAFYGDDFTGSSENLAQFHRYGLSSFMFLRRPSPEEFLVRAREVDVIGIAGIARSLSPERMVEEVEPVFRLFANAGIRFVQYKICSTFDSALHVGNLAVVAKIARRVFPGAYLPVFAAMPEFGRYTAFGNHFACFGDAVYPLDRHPSMVRHPVTPMSEPDLLEILSAQGAADVRLIDLRALNSGLDKAREKLTEIISAKSGLIVFDGITDDHCALVATLALEQVHCRPVVALAAQGLAYGLGRHLRGASPSLMAIAEIEPLASANSLLVLSGSCASQNARQISHFSASGASIVRLPASALIDPGRREAEIASAVIKTSTALDEAGSVAVVTAFGPDDPDIVVTRNFARKQQLTPAIVSKRVGGGLADIVKSISRRNRLQRVVFAGGDTSSYALSALNGDGLTVASGDYKASAHVFRLSVDGPFAGLEIVLKGGQVGDDAFFSRLREGRTRKIA
jgi:uncharacterized protein YgbK (DUF1537 family)